MDAHPVADLFPMLADEELKDLAADIAERGLLQPIILDDQGRILDGRNRFAACELAGIDPVFESYAGPDPDGYALSVNLSRRHLTAGQRAMIAAQAAAIFKKSQRAAAADHGVAQARVAYAATVIEFASDLVAGVVAGTVALNDAYATARGRKRAAEDQDTTAARLLREAPDLADAVTEERMTVDDAFAALADRRLDVERAERVAVIDEVFIADGAVGATFAKRVEGDVLTWAEADTLSRQWLRERDEALDRTARRIERVNEGWGAIEEVISNPDKATTAALIERLSESDRAVLRRIVAQVKPKGKR